MVSYQVIVKVREDYNMDIRFYLTYFFIVMDVLSRLLDKAESVQGFGYHPRSENLSLTP